MIALEDFSCLEEGDVEGFIERELYKMTRLLFATLVRRHSGSCVPTCPFLIPFSVGFKSSGLDGQLSSLILWSIVISDCCLSLLFFCYVSYISMDQKCTILGPIE